MFAKLRMALRNQGASQGKPFLNIQVLGIPLVALIFLVLRISLEQRPGSVNAKLQIEGVDLIHFQGLNLFLVGLLIFVYAADFFYDALRWDELGYPFVGWYFVLMLFWLLLSGSIIVFMLVYNIFFCGQFLIFCNGTFFSSVMDLFAPLTGVFGGGMVYFFFKNRGGVSAAIFCPLCIAFVFNSALFADQNIADNGLLYIQGFCLFLLNVILMQWFEQDKDLKSDSVNIWLLFSPLLLWGFQFFLAVVILCLTFFIDFESSGLWMLLVMYGVMGKWPSIFRNFRLYRILVDAGLLLWLI